MATLDRWEPFRGFAPESQLNRVFSDLFNRASQDQNLTTWAPAVDIYEAEHELVVKADLPDVKAEDLDIRVENNILTIRGERKFEKIGRSAAAGKEADEKNYLRIERAYGSFARSFSLANTVNTEAIKADYKDGVLTLSIPKREEAKPKQIKVSVGSPNLQAAAAVAR
jgi:HSP20 family protein